jgi:hypothetical protein
MFASQAVRAAVGKFMAKAKQVRPFRVLLFESDLTQSRPSDFILLYRSLFIVITIILHPMSLCNYFSSNVGVVL